VVSALFLGLSHRQLNVGIEMYGILFVGRPLRAPQAGQAGCCCCYRAS